MISGSWGLLQVCLVGTTISFPQAQNLRARMTKARSVKTLRKSGAQKDACPLSEAWHLLVTFFSSQSDGRYGSLECLSVLQVQC